MKDNDSVHKVVNKEKGGKRGPKQHPNDGQKDNQNKFQVLKEEEVNTKEDQAMEGSPEEKEKEDTHKQIKYIDNQNEAMMSDAELEMDPERTQSEMELEDKEHLDLEGFLIQGTTGGVDSVPQEELNRIQ